ncbi:MAG: discoidin domain-containing protein [Bacteroidetes bacterium]|nr:discoidin domain-containing protein [Bacteroidota bacterium]
MRPLLPLLLLAASPLLTRAQCDTVRLAKAGWSIVYVDSQELTGEGANNGHAAQAIDGDSLTFWHTQWQGAQPGFPHEIQIDLGAVHAVNGISLLSRAGTGAGKAKGYTLYLSTDLANWGPVQSAGDLAYADPNAGSQRGSAWFGAVDARYVRMVMTSNYDGGPYIMLAEFDVFESTGPGCGATGQNNQVVTINPIADQATTAAPLTLGGTASSGLAVTYAVESGPATVNGNTLTLGGAAGTVTVRAEQAGNTSWYPGSASTSFQVLDLATYFPEVQTKLTDAFPLEMPALHAYALYATASIGRPDFNSITGVAFSVDGTTLPASWVNGAWQAWWTPNGYGAHTVTATATASNGNTGTHAVTVNVVNSASTQVAPTFAGAVINFDGSAASRWYYGNYVLPQSVGAYRKIMAQLTVTCPNVPGGCDDWDRLAWIEAQAPNGDWVEIIRYITPYGKACNHSLDVTDFASLLQGNTPIRMFIDTWGTGGWQLNLDFTYEAGAPDHLYTTVQKVWHGDYNFGDPANLQPVDTVLLTPGFGVDSVSLRLVTTGHGWGQNNTGNAAEFYNATHNVYVNNGPGFTQHLWTTCNPNPDGCQPQSGTWTYNRAGWCPGSIAKPFSYDLSPLLPEAPFSLTYIFQPSYTDYCNAHNPACVSGVTCPDCNDGYNPFYHVGAYLISHANSPLNVGIGAPAVRQPENALTVAPNPCDGHFRLQLKAETGPCTVTLHDISGRGLKVWYFNNRSQVEAYTFDVAKLGSGTWFVKVQGKDYALAGKVVVQ